MSPRILLSAALRALPVVGPLLRRLDRVELFILLHEAQIDILTAKAGIDRHAKAPSCTSTATSPAPQAARPGSTSATRSN
jgi:hypothetical protein